MAFPAGFITPWHLKIGATQVERTREWGGGSCHRTRTGWNPVQLGGSCGEFTDRTEMGIWKPTLIICSTKRTFVSTKEFKGAFRQKKKL